MKTDIRDWAPNYTNILTIFPRDKRAIWIFNYFRRDTIFCNGGCEALCPTNVNVCLPETRCQTYI